MTQRVRWFRRGVGWPTKYGPAHTADPGQIPLMGKRAYCGTWLPGKRDHLWDEAAPEDRRCRECERGDQLRRERAAAVAVHPDHPRGTT